MCARWIIIRKRCERILGAYLMLVLFGCTETIYFYPPDKSQCITVITKKRDAHRYIIAGKHVRVPEKNFVKLNVESGDRYRDDFCVCWKSEQYEWEVVVHNANVIESTLDTTRFNFRTALPADDRGIPTQLKFTKRGCAVFSFYAKEFSSDKGEAIVEFK